ncbi:hypothetical protein SMICM304S_00784 [Streptomyces microflavus]
MAFGITEPDAGSNSHRITTTARRDGHRDWLLTGRKVFVSGVDIADATLIVGRTELCRPKRRSGPLKPCLFIVPRDAAGFGRRPRSTWNSTPPSSSSSSSSTTYGCRPTPWSATRTRGCSSSSPV